MDNMEFPTRARAVKDKSQRKIFDWTREPRPDHITPFQKFILDVDWEKSPLGPIKQWPIQLRQMVLLIVQDPSPAGEYYLFKYVSRNELIGVAVVYWGDDATIVYNEAYIQLIGQKHPALQGQDPKIEFAEIWDHFEKLLVRQREDAQTTVEANAYLLLFRHGFFGAWFSTSLHFRSSTNWFQRKHISAGSSYLSSVKAAGLWDPMPRLSRLLAK